MRNSIGDNQTDSQLVPADVSPFQIAVITICILINAVEGYDVLVMAYVAPAVARTWALSGGQLGVLFSASLLGIAVGALILSSWSDRAGRRPVALGCLALISAGMLLSSFAHDLAAMAAARVVTGIGVGGLLACTNVLVAEHAPLRLRSSAISLLGAGYTAGAMSGGMLARWLLETSGWRAAFMAGAGLSLILLLVAALLLPESIAFLLSRRPANALERLNRVLRSMRQPELATLPPPRNGPPHTHGRVRQLFGNGNRGRTIALWVAAFMQLSSLYFTLSWTPKLLAASPLTQPLAIRAGVALNLGGLAGSLLFSVIAQRFDLRKLTAMLLLLTALAAALFGVLVTQPTLIEPLAALVGLCAFASMSGIWSIAPALYPTAARGQGVGWAVSVGRVGAILSPFIAGMLADAGVASSSLYVVFSVPFACAALAILMLAAPIGKANVDESREPA
ncbi:MFS transporter [Burkholderia pseudomallei]|uniref:MFS transporter n=1 Tax=Burkholderia pseudomallei TaxID=28450 RepID=UPI001AD61B85|nr:MFS transporter [Burkholderia pseudomallei]MBO7934037.1 MFS transporter [Burkholderia pseudomallei]